MPEKANVWDHISAFFNKDVAVNKDGYLVRADSLFDSGSDSTDYLNNSQLYAFDDWSNPFRSTDFDYYNTAFSPPSLSADYSDLSDYQAVSGQLSNDILDAAAQQQQAAQTSADRAMDFSRDMFQMEADYNSAEAAMNRDFQRELFDENWEKYLAARGSEYQTAMEDMKKAGLNPKLVSQLGGASTSMASTPGGAQASASAPSGISANMVMANMSALSNVLSTYISGADALDRNQNDFVQGILSSIIKVFPFFIK